MSDQVKRLLYAVFLLSIGLALVLLVPLQRFDAQPGMSSFELTTPHSKQQPHSAGLGAYVDEDAFAERVFAELGQAFNEGSLPEGFTSEVLGTSLTDTAQVYSLPGVVGLHWSSEQGMNKDKVSEDILAHGWQRVAAANMPVSYVKDTGSFQWLALLVFENVTSFSVVLYYR